MPGVFVLDAKNTEIVLKMQCLRALEKNFLKKCKKVIDCPLVDRFTLQLNIGKGPNIPDL